MRTNRNFNLYTELCEALEKLDVIVENDEDFPSEIEDRKGQKRNKKQIARIRARKYKVTRRPKMMKANDGQA